jgi:Concanavalin A-like lectin/glucanases superfamily
MMRLGIGFGTAGLLLFAVACSDDTGTTNPVGGAGSPAAGTSSGGSASGSAAGGMAGAATAGATTGGGGTGAGGANGGSAGSGGGSGGSGGASGGSGGSGGASGGSGGGGACDTKPGKALKFDGGKIDILSANLGTDLPGGNVNRTIELWAKFTGESSWTPERSVMETGKHVTAGNQILGLDMSGRKSATQGLFGPYTNGFSDNNGGQGVVVDAAPDVGWLHIAWSFDTNTGLSFTVNGVKKPVQMGDTKLTLDFTPGIVTLGCSQNFGMPEGWAGVMDEVKIWSVSKTPADILANMHVVPKADTAGLVAYYRFNEATGTDVADEAKKAPHTLKACSATGEICPAVNNAAPTWVDSDIPGTFTCAP